MWQYLNQTYNLQLSKAGLQMLESKCDFRDKAKVLKQLEAFSFNERTIETSSLTKYNFDERNKQQVFIHKPIAVEVLSVRNIGISQMDQGENAVSDHEGEEDEEEFENEYLDASLKVQGRKKAAAGGAQRMFKL